MKIAKLLVCTLVALLCLPSQKTIERTTLSLTNRCPDCLLSHANFYHVDLSGADLRNTNLRGTTFIEVNLNDADLRGVDLRNAYFEDVSLKNTNLCGAIMMDGQKSPTGCWDQD